jgi:hypothetical protein
MLDTALRTFVELSSSHEHNTYRAFTEFTALNFGRYLLFPEGQSLRKMTESVCQKIPPEKFET